jgi:uncharacterized integral membrane protein
VSTRLEPRAQRTAAKVATPAAIGAALIVAALLAFVFQNTATVTVSWLVLDATLQVWILIVATAVLTLAAERLVTYALRRRQR